MENKDRKFLKGALTGALVMLILIVGIGTALYFGAFGGTLLSGQGGLQTRMKLGVLSTLIDEYYLYDTSEEELQEGIYAGFINALGDKYSRYYDEEATKSMLESSAGQYSGIGAGFAYNENGDMEIVHVYEGAPAEAAGLLVGDILYQVDDHVIVREMKNQTYSEKLEEVQSWIKGEAGTEVVLHVYRDDVPMELKITRAEFTLPTVSSEMMEDSIGYLRIEEFDQVTYEQFQTAMADLESQGMQKLVIDLRGNPGGDVDVTCDILRQLLPEGLIVYTEDKNGKRVDYSCDGKNTFEKPLVVLVDQNSASASEIFTGAVQDYGIGTIVGTTTYGKGIVQNLYNLQDGTYVALTNSEYFTPKGRSIHEKGIEPDVVVGYEEDTENPDADNQLQKAMEVLKEN